MLDPHDRQLYLDALKPPHGYVLGEAVATTYSLDMTTLLGVPVALVLPHLDASRLSDENVLDVMQALRHASSRLTIFCNPAGMSPPQAGQLYGMLEPVIIEAAAPHGGSLHAKLWLVRFDPMPGEAAEPCMRLVALSRNLTGDASWDVSVVLDGTLGGGRKKVNQPLTKLLERLPSCALRPLPEPARERLTRLADQVARADWELPEGFDDLTFHVLGIGKKPEAWLPEPSDRLVVISPFVTASTLAKLQASTKEAVALISRGEELDPCDQTLIAGFDGTFVLDTAATQGDGEDTIEEAPSSQPRGLHAKVYLDKRGWNTHLYLGSANATASALNAGRNIELLVELWGKTSQLPGKGIDGLLGDAGFGALLKPYEPPTEPVEVDAAALKAEADLRNAASILARAELRLRFEARDDQLIPVLHAPQPVKLPGIQEAWAWLITSDMSTARQVHPLARGEEVELVPCGPASATGFVAFDLLAEAADARTQVVLNLPVDGMPADRDAHVVRLVVKNGDRLIRYILSLLHGLDPYVRAGLDGTRRDFGGSSAGNLLGAGLLEHLVRSKARHPERLDDVRSLLQALVATEEGRAMVSEELLTLWTTVTGEVLR